MHDRKDKWSVGEWMTPNPKMVENNMSVRSAFFCMKIEGIRHLLVADGDKLLGIVSDRDLRRPDITDEPDGWDDFYRLDEDYEVCDIMSDEVVTVTTHDTLEKAMKLMIQNKFSALPVLDKNDKPIGIITSHDTMRAFMLALDMVGDDLRQKSND